MPKLVLNGREYTGSVTIQYNNPEVYSTEEREIGVWTDGKPLYQKTIIINNPSWSVEQSTNSYTFSYPLANVAANIETIYGLFGYGKRASGTRIPLNFARIDSSSDFTIFVVRPQNSDIWFVCKYGSDQQLCVTLQYTKTTDTAGSGIWGTNGNLAHHYSTNEQVVGTWVDGSTLYEKTYVLTSYTEGVNCFIEHGITNLGMVIKLFGTCKRGNKRIALPFFHQTTDDWSINIYDADASTGKITFWAGVNNAQNLTDIYVTMQYTKTT